MTGKQSFFVIINPISGNGKGKKVWHKIQSKLNHLYAIDFAFTKYAKHETIVAQNAIKKGFKHFIIVGGDGTLSNFIDGAFNQDYINPKDITFGVIPIGTGNDWIKTHQIPKNTNKALQRIIDGKTDTQDIGCISSFNITNSNKYFINLAGVGFDGLVVDLVKNNRSFGKLTYIFGALKGLLNFSVFDANVTIDSRVKDYKNCFIIQLGICKYTGSSMQLTKQADPKDGLLDVTIATNLTKWDIIRNLPKLFNGKIVNHKKVKTFKSKSIKIMFNSQQVLMQADGELIQKYHIEVSILHNAIRFYS